MRIVLRFSIISLRSCCICANEQDWTHNWQLHSSLHMCNLQTWMTGRSLVIVFMHIKNMKELNLTIEAFTVSVIHWWADASFAVHEDFKSHTGATMTMGKGCPINASLRNKKSTHEVLLRQNLGINDAMAMISWVRLFLQAQGFTVTDNVVFQDNQSTMLLAKNG